MAERTRAASAEGGVTDEFWAAVEAEVNAPDLEELGRFLEADQLPFSLRPEFEQSLLGALVQACLLFEATASEPPVHR